ncbi:MAG: TatD family hydrolase [Bacteroidales bacterium]|nr:TatD family hydrolase [Bacteroidales bacterium]
MLVDTHTHLYLPEFDTDLPQAVSRAVNQGVKYMFLPNIDLESINPLLKVCSQFPENCFPMLGMHPTSVKADYKKELDAILGYFDKAPFIAIGEIGIDLYWDKTYLKEQIEAFRFQLDFALTKNLPVVIHCRDSFQPIMDVLKDYKNTSLTGVFHAFSGPIEQAEMIIRHGFKLGIGGVLTYKNAKLKDTLALVSPEHIILETDSPYLTPVPKRGERNESAFVTYVCHKLAETKNMRMEELADITTANALKLFNIRN